MTIKPSMRRMIWERDQGICGICALPVDPSEYHVDHIRAQSLGGGHDDQNLRVSHRICNIRRGNGQPRVKTAGKFVSLQVRLPDELESAIRSLSQKEDRPLARVMSQLLRIGLQRATRAPEGGER